jgi:cytochrome c biogenesis protein CcmG, thiol:disulfide interchange protein DsbE
MQPTKKHFLYLVILLIGLLWIGLSAAPKSGTTSGQIPAPRQGFLAPDFRVTTLDGQTLTLSDLRGAPVLLNFWASWCPPCKAEMPAMQKIYQEYAGRGLIVLAVNASAQDDVAAARAFLLDYGLTFPVGLDMQNEAMRAFNVTSLPSTYFIRADGIIEEVVIGGPMAEALLRTRVEKILEGYVP